MALTQSKLDAAFRVLVICAELGRRCPTAGEGITPAIIARLAREGHIRSDVSGRNWRTVTILVGPHAGKTTMPDPLKARVWLVTDEKGTRRIPGVTAAPARRDRPQPSLPRIF
jgi:hypothetical protein